VVCMYVCVYVCKCDILGMVRRAHVYLYIGVYYAHVYLYIGVYYAHAYKGVVLCLVLLCGRMTCWCMYVHESVDRDHLPTNCGVHVIRGKDYARKWMCGFCM
jgi:hypothetical protein